VPLSIADCMYMRTRPALVSAKALECKVRVRPLGTHTTHEDSDILTVLQYIVFEFLLISTCSAVD
jgi:hypothetical protein